MAHVRKHKTLRSSLQAAAAAVPPVKMAGGKKLLLTASPVGAGARKQNPGKFLFSIALILSKGTECSRHSPSPQCARWPLVAGRLRRCSWPPSALESESRGRGSPPPPSSSAIVSAHPYVVGTLRSQTPKFRVQFFEKKKFRVQTRSNNALRSRIS